MAVGQLEKIIAKTFLDIADGLDKGYCGNKPTIALNGIGSEHGEGKALQAAVIANGKAANVVYIGTLKAEGLECKAAVDEQSATELMEALLASGEIDGAVTMHYPLPIGVSTVGRIVTPGLGKAMYIATTTGAAAANRVEAMVKNALYGIITAKACGLKNPSVGILNIDGAGQTEGILKKLQQNGYDIRFARSARAGGGSIMRGNDLLTGSCDVMVTDSLTGNVLVKIFSAFTTGGGYESVGWGYGPGIGENQENLVLIISRASGIPVVAGAIGYAAEMVQGKYHEIVKNEFEKANKAGLQEALSACKATRDRLVSEEIPPVPKEIVTSQIFGIEIMDIEDAVRDLLKAEIYAESCMGCTGPLILVSAKNREAAEKILKDHRWVSS